jgi:hypothetical protein
MSDRLRVGICGFGVAGGALAIFFGSRRAQRDIARTGSAGWPGRRGLPASTIWPAGSQRTRLVGARHWIAAILCDPVASLADGIVRGGSEQGFLNRLW